VKSFVKPILPLSSDPSNRFLPWIIGFMVWLATLAFAASMILSNISKNWEGVLTGAITIQIIPSENDDTQILKNKTQKLLALLSKIPAIESASIVTLDEINKMLQPWLGEKSLSTELGIPIPVLIDARLKKNMVINTDALSASLKATVKGVRLNDHALWVDRLLEFTQAIRIVALTIMVLVIISAITTVVFSTRTGLTIHSEIIELTHFIGAREEFIRNQFSINTFKLAIKGGLCGLITSSATLLFLGSIMEGVGIGLIPPVHLTAFQWLGVGGIGLTAIFISTVTANLTAKIILRRMT
tara:strand:+ start:4911 stop:5807 length:897 start_codon:yes stop_codon:yes gene_type:complete